MMKRYLIIWMVIFFLFSCEDPFKNNTYQPYDVYPTATYLDTRTEDFSMWIEILHYAGLYNAVNQASMTYTSFVPSNEAVSAFFKRKGIASIHELGTDYARDLVQYHIINAEVPQKEFLLGGKLKSQTISGHYLSVSFEDQGEGGLNSVYLNKEARVTELANKTTNGLVYVLDNVLTPLVETIYDRLVETSSYSIFKQAVEMTGWKNRLDAPLDTVYSATGQVSYIRKNFTLFAVSDAVFLEQGISDVNGLVAKVGAGSDYTNDANELRKYVGYHLISQTHFAEDIFTFGDDSTVIWTTQSPNQIFSTNKVGQNFYINYKRASGTGVKLIEGKVDIPAKNGVIHEVDALMLPTSPDPMTVIWDLCSFDDVESVVNAFGAEKKLGDIYQTYQSSEHQITFSENEVSSYTWKAYSSASNWPSLGYLVTKAGGSGNSYGANLNDMLIVNLGYLGNVTMKTPVLLKGKYKVELYYACAGSLKDFINGGSKCQFSFDNQSQEVYVYDGAKASVGIYSLTMFDEVEFNETTHHNFKVLLMDSRATSHSSYRLQLDYVKFIPVFD